MLSATHLDADAGDTPVNGEFMVFYDLWQAMNFTEIIEILGGMFLGRKEGHARWPGDLRQR